MRNSVLFVFTGPLLGLPAHLMNSYTLNEGSYSLIAFCSLPFLNIVLGGFQWGRKRL